MAIEKTFPLPRHPFRPLRQRRRHLLLKLRAKALHRQALLKRQPGELRFSRAKAGLLQLESEFDHAERLPKPLRRWARIGSIFMRRHKQLFLAFLQAPEQYIGLQYRCLIPEIGPILLVRLYADDPFDVPPLAARYGPVLVVPAELGENRVLRRQLSDGQETFALQLAPREGVIGGEEIELKQALECDDIKESICRQRFLCRFSVEIIVACKRGPQTFNVFGLNDGSDINVLRRSRLSDHGARYRPDDHEIDSCQRQHLP